VAFRIFPTPDVKQIRVLVADDSALMRRTLRQVIESDPEFEFLGAARDGEDVLQKARELKPDVISMDINMPKLDGVTALQIIVEEAICPVVMLSSLTHKGAVTTFECLELGAFDYVGKPDGTVSSNLGTVARELILKLKAAAGVGTLQRTGKQRRELRQGLVRNKPAAPETDFNRLKQGATFKAIAIGISTGGPATIMEVLPQLPADLSGAVFMVQHMPVSFTNAFARRLNDACDLKVVEVEAGMEVHPGYCYVARGDAHLTLYRKLSGQVFIRMPTTPLTLFVPSVNVMMESVLAVYGRDTIGVLMTGIGDDGADQMMRIKEAGGYTIAESEESCVVYGMPREVIERGGACEVRPSWDIAKAVLRRM
jgi:two-component system chemotaxis response regulator CheB